MRMRKLSGNGSAAVGSGMLAVAAAFALALALLAGAAAPPAASAASVTGLTYAYEEAGTDAPGLVAVHAAASAGPHYFPGAPMVVVSDTQADAARSLRQSGPGGAAFIDAVAPLALMDASGATVSNLSVHAAGAPTEARITQAVAVLLVIMAGAAALIGAFVLRRTSRTGRVEAAAPSRNGFVDER